MFKKEYNEADESQLRDILQNLCTPRSCQGHQNKSSLKDCHRQKDPKGREDCHVGS